MPSEMQFSPTSVSLLGKLQEFKFVKVFTFYFVLLRHEADANTITCFRQTTTMCEILLFTKGSGTRNDEKPC